MFTKICYKVFIEIFYIIRLRNFFLDAVFAEEVYIHPATQVTYESQAVFLICDTKDKHRWTKNGMPITTPHVEMVNTLVLYDVGEKDIGTYYCHGLERNQFRAQSELLVGGNYIFVKMYVIFW